MNKKGEEATGFSLKTLITIIIAAVFGFILLNLIILMFVGKGTPFIDRVFIWFKGMFGGL